MFVVCAAIGPEQTPIVIHSLRLKAQVEISKLIEQLSLLEQRKLTAEARINSLLFREPETPLGKPEEIKPRDFTYGLAELNELALTNYPTLKAQRRKIDREQYGVELARKDFYPDFSMGFTYFNRPGMPEMYGVNVGVKIPIYFWQKQRPALAEATASAAAYNAGEARVQRIINTTGVRDFDELARRRLLPAETRNYVPAVLAAWSQISTAGTGMNNATAIQAQPRSVE